MTPLNPSPDTLRRGDVLAYRRFALLAAIATPVIGYLHLRVFPAAVDPPALRAGVTALCLLVVAQTYLRPSRLLLRLIYCTFYVYSAWSLQLLVWNQFHPDYAIGTLVAIAAVIVGFLDYGPLRWYLVFTSASLAWVFHAVPEIPPQSGSVGLFAAYFVVFCVLAYLTLRGRLSILETLAASRMRFALAAAGSNDGLWDWDLRTDRVHYSTRWKGMLGHDEHELSDSPDEWLDRVHPGDVARVRHELARHVEGETEHFQSEFRLRHRDGHWRWMLARGVAQRGADGRARRMAGSQTDVTERKRAAEQLLHDAMHDALTGLPNRALFLDRLSQVFRRRRKDPSAGFAVLFVDLDRFKVINDSLGHQAGDELLRQVAQRLAGCVRAEDTVARLGGDEFALVLSDLPGEGEVARVAGRIHQEVSTPVVVQGREVVTSASIGIALGPGDYTREEDMLRDADLAMYRAKSMGPGRHTLFDESLHARSLAALELETDLRQAAERGELRLHFQPIVRLEDQSLRGFEALVRWEHPTRGLLPPGEFIPLAEETGLISSIGHWVLEASCRQLQQWRQRFPAPAPHMVSVNVSGRQLAQPGFVAEVAAVLRSTGLPAECLRLEITESVLLGDPDAAVVVLQALRELGVHVDLDDFGTGYSSFSYLHRFPIDAVKIDRSFVQRMDVDGRNASIVRTLMALAETLGVSVVAEGVETAGELRQLQEILCPAAQGYLFAAPMDAERAEALLRAHSPAVEVPSLSAR